MLADSQTALEPALTGSSKGRLQYWRCWSLLHDCRMMLISVDVAEMAPLQVQCNDKCDRQSWGHKQLVLLWMTPVTGCQLEITRLGNRLADLSRVTSKDTKLANNSLLRYLTNMMQDPFTNTTVTTLYGFPGHSHWAWHTAMSARSAFCSISLFQSFST